MLSHIRWLTVLVVAYFMASVPAPAAPVVVIPMKGEIDSRQVRTIRSGIARAEQEKAELIILEIDSFGGRVDSAFEEMDALMATNIPTVAFVNRKGISGAAAVAFAANKIYVHPAAVFGASTVILNGGNPEPDPAMVKMAKKATAMVVAKVCSAAEKNGHPLDVATAIVDIEAEVVRGRRKIDGDKTLLTLTAAEALREYDGKPLIGSGHAESLERLLALTGAQGPVIRIQESPDMRPIVIGLVGLCIVAGGGRLLLPFFVR